MLNFWPFNRTQSENKIPPGMDIIDKIWEMDMAIDRLSDENEAIVDDICVLKSESRGTADCVIFNAVVMVKLAEKLGYIYDSEKNDWIRIVKKK